MQLGRAPLAGLTQSPRARDSFSLLSAGARFAVGGLPVGGLPVGGLPLGGVSDGGVFLGGSEFTGSPSSFATFTVTSADASLPSMSRATAVSLWLPFGTLMLPHWIE